MSATFTYAPLAHSPAGPLAFKAGSGALVHKTPEQWQPPDPPALTQWVNGWRWYVDFWVKDAGIEYDDTGRDPSDPDCYGTWEASDFRGYVSSDGDSWTRTVTGSYAPAVRYGSGGYTVEVCPSFARAYVASSLAGGAYPSGCGFGPPSRPPVRVDASGAYPVITASCNANWSLYGAQLDYYEGDLRKLTPGAQRRLFRGTIIFGNVTCERQQ